jgi:carbamate kinase
VRRHLAVLAISGNSLIRDKNHVALSSQYEAVQETSKYIAELIADGLSRVITHGNGPQVGFLYRRGELARHELPLIPLDICGTDTQGAIGYMIEMALLNEFHKLGIRKKVAAVVTRTIVGRDDPSLQNSTRPIGSLVSEEEALSHKNEFGWHTVEDAGRGFRRVVPSPIPREIIELNVIRLLVEEGTIVIAAGGGGVPVIRNQQGGFEGVEAVIDKDLGSSLLAKNLGADTFVISTAVDAVYLNFGKKDQKAIRRAALPEIKEYMLERHFKPGSMMPKIEAIITSPENLLKAVKGEAGTTITK